tara:strand:+ start:99 stop:1268 length:1170 start_codon:yes stop_codon:yes gene_type:complete
MNFENTEHAYKLKSNRELFRALYLFKLISNQRLVAFLTKVVTLAIKFKLPISFLFKYTVFKQFCSGISEKDSIDEVDRLASYNVKSYMHYASESQKSEVGMDESLTKILDTLKFSSGKSALQFTVFKATSLGPIDLFEKVSAGIGLNYEEKNIWRRVLKRIEVCCKTARSLNVKIFIDAEESWIQSAIDDIAESMMAKFNTNKAYVFTTIQMYRIDRLAYLKKIIDKAEEKNFLIGVKLVRGAYMEKENIRAKNLGISSPICKNKKATDLNFDKALEHIIDKVHICNLFIGSHNEESIIKATKLMNKYKYKNNHPFIWFSQLYGMADHISFNLALEGYQVVKYVPFGPVKEVIPYLIRRAEENTSVSGQTPRELNLIKKEIRRRKINSV